MSLVLEGFMHEIISSFDVQRQLFLLIDPNVLNTSRWTIDDDHLHLGSFTYVSLKIYYLQ